MTGEDATAWAYKPTRWDRITAWPFEGGPLRSVFAGAGIVAVAIVLFGGIRFGLEAALVPPQYDYRAELAPLCDSAPTARDGRTVRHYAGTVVDRPAAAGFWGTNSGPDRRLGEVLFVRIDGRDEPIGVRHLPGELPATGTPLRFCAIDDEARYWWPLVGYESGRNGGRLYGEPSGPFDAVMWLRDG